MDGDLKELIPDFLTNMNEDLKSMTESLQKDDYKTVEILGHSMKGSGGGYGFDKISEIGKLIEQSAREKNGVEIQKGFEELSFYLEHIEVVYE